MSRGGIGLLWGLSAGQRRRFALAVAAMLIATGLGYLAPLIVKDTFDKLNAGGSDMRRLGWAAALIVAVTLAACIFTYLRGHWIAYASEAMARDLRERLYDRLQHARCSFHDTAETGDLVQRCTSDVEMIRLLLSTQLVEIVRTVVMVLIALPIMLSIDGRMTLAAVGLLPVIVTFSVVFFIKVRGSFQAVEETEGALTTTLQENLTGVRVVRAFARQAFEYSKFEARNAAHRQAHWRLYRVLAAFWPVSDIMVFAQHGLVLYFGARYVMNDEISLGTWVAFQMYVTIYIWPVRQMGRILAELGKAVVSLQRVGHILNADPEENSELGTRNAELDRKVPSSEFRVPKSNGRIEFSNVTFRHGAAPDSPNVLDGVSFAVEPGQTVAILGPSGCGKTTIFHLLLRFYDAASGTITIDGLDITSRPRKSIRSEIGVVMQEPFLFARSLRENIALGRHGVGDDEIHEASTAAAIHETIERFGEGYNTVIGERGITLSGGQRQRVALARALLRRPPILLLDDAFSAVDTRTEAMILRALQRRHGKQTTLLIAHRVSTLMHADTILVMEHGRITMRGSHDELIRTDGLYRRLWELQRSDAQEIAA